MRRDGSLALDDVQGLPPTQAAPYDLGMLADSLALQEGEGAREEELAHNHEGIAGHIFSDNRSKAKLTEGDTDYMQLQRGIHK
jgi:hypothetical protein